MRSLHAEQHNGEFLKGATVEALVLVSSPNENKSSRQKDASNLCEEGAHFDILLKLFFQRKFLGEPAKTFFRSSHLVSISLLQFLGTVEGTVCFLVAFVLLRLFSQVLLSVVSKPRGKHALPSPFWQVHRLPLAQRKLLGKKHAVRAGRKQITNLIPEFKVPLLAKILWLLE